MEESCVKTTDHILKVYFRHVSPKQIIAGRIPYQHFPEDVFAELCRAEMRYLSDTDIAAVYAEISGKGCRGESDVNVFQLLKRVTEELLIIREGRPVCRYEGLLRWRMLVQFLGEDLPVCAYLARRTERMSGGWSDFAWETVIRHDNMQLNHIMEKGMADNHFHLFGAAPAFHLIWLKLMNLPNNSSCRKAVRQIGKRRRVVDTVSQKQDMDDDMEVLLYQAALIRFTLFQFLYFASADVYEEDILGAGDTGGDDYKEIDVNFSEYTKDKLSGSDYMEYAEGRLGELPAPNLWFADLQERINLFRQMSDAAAGEATSDYFCLLETANHGSLREVESERFLIYHMLTGRMNRCEIPEKLMQWFYAYLVIKGKFYRELVQVNETIGFENFHIYSSRKGAFLHSAADRKRMVQSAVIEPLDRGSICSIEMRISPANTVKDYRDKIIAYDSYIAEEGKRRERLEKCCYIVHFSKAEDEKLPEWLCGITNHCRHRSLREKLQRQAEALIRFREHAQRQAARVYAIDACSQEIGCRPEVFAPIFRRLTEHVVSKQSVYKVPQLKMTYHAGEDFLDLADGLRAIDEAMLFLNMKRGDRLGHATALGLDVTGWYESKKHVVNLPLHDYLDNIVWLYQKLIDYDIHNCENLKGYLVREYERVFGRIYGKFINTEFVQTIAGGRMRTDIHAYYAAWKLRGDDPSCYLDMYTRISLRDEEHFADLRGGLYRGFPEADTVANRMRYRERINWELVDGDEIRRNESAIVLYLLYHYSADIRKTGECFSRQEMPPVYVEGVKAVQKAMQGEVARKGIGIETNPSSNYQISALEHYQDHPIIHFYNLGLTVDAAEISTCPQLHVSINTDDCGVFHTSLENEFALMGCALEQMQRDDGSYRYQGQMIYEWLNRVREMGLEQRFKKENTPEEMYWREKQNGEQESGKEYQ